MSQRQATLLIIDDERDMLDLLHATATSGGFNVVEAENGSTALDIVRAHKIDVILSDLRMPVMDGMEFFETIRRENINTPLIFLTGYGQQSDKVKALGLGAFDFLDKPFSKEELLLLLDDARKVSYRLQALAQNMPFIEEDLDPVPAVLREPVSHNETTRTVFHVDHELTNDVMMIFASQLTIHSMHAKTLIATAMLTKDIEQRFEELSFQLASIASVADRLGCTEVNHLARRLEKYYIANKPGAIHLSDVPTLLQIHQFFQKMGQAIHSRTPLTNEDRDQLAAFEDFFEQSRKNAP